MSELSPQAQAVLDASKGIFWRPVIDVPTFHNKSIAAALRAAADQVVPEPRYRSVTAPGVVQVVWAIRDELLAIATELENQ